MRVPIPNDKAQKVFDTGGRVVGLLVQNQTAADIYTASTAGELDKVNESTGVPYQGVKWGAGMQQPICIPRFNGVFFARAQNVTELEITVYEVECTC